MLRPRRILALAALGLACAQPGLSQPVASVPLQFFELKEWVAVDDGRTTRLLGYFLTADPSETSVVRARGEDIATTYEDAAFVFSRPVAGAVPLLRYRSRTGGDHLYTTSQAEGEQAVTRFDYIPESICCYIFATQVPGSVPLYRLQRDSLHFYTIDPVIREERKAQKWFDEGITGFVYPTQLSRNPG